MTLLMRKPYPGVTWTELVTAVNDLPHCKLEADTPEQPGRLTYAQRLSHSQT
jgi:hypothetical protein